MVLPPGQVVEATSQSGSSVGAVPADGRLRGPDFTAVVSRVAWPQSVDAPSAQYVAGSAHRLVSFTLSVTQATDDSGTLNAPTGVSASLRVGDATQSIDLTRIDQAIAGGASGTAETTGTDSFVASVPAREHDVDLVLTEAGFTQSFDLWTLQRLPPSPAVLYRDASSSTVTGSAASSFNVAFTNPADGFSSSDNAQVSSATLSWFAPGGSGTTPGSTSQAFLVVGLQSSYPDVPYGQPNSGHFFSSFTPLPGNRLTFTPTGGTAVTGTSSTTAFSSTGAASDDDGLFDSVYWFTVPASTTGGTLTVTAGPATGTEYTGFTGSGNAVPINVTAPSTVSLSFPAAPAALPAQKKPPWVGAALPATGLGAANDSTTRSTGGGAFPIWLAVVVLVVVAGLVVAVQRVRRRQAPDAVVPTASLDDAVTTDIPTETTVQATTDTPAPTAPIVRDNPGAVVTPKAVGILGWRRFVGFPVEGATPSLEALATYLALHDAHHLSADQIALGMWPFGRSRGEVSRKTVHNNLSALRGWVGAEHLPDAAVAGGYLLEGIDSDWATFQRLAREADTVDAEAARALRTQALGLVRGRPFDGLTGDGYDWIEAEGLLATVTKAIVTCATRLGTELMDLGEYAAAEEAVRAGLRGSPDEYALFELGARVARASGGRRALERWLAETDSRLDAADVERIRSALGHDDTES